MSGSGVSGRASTPVSGTEKARPDSEALDMMPTVRLAVDTDADDLVACKPAQEVGGLELQMLYVMAPWRRLGLGSRFVDLVESETRRRGQSSLELWSDTRFLDAHRLYRSLGFEQLPDVRELHDLSATREYRFRKSL